MGFWKSDLERYMIKMKCESEREYRTSREYRKQRTTKLLRMTFFSPVIVVLRAVAAAAHFVGLAAAVGMPYGIYAAYKTARGLFEGEAFATGYEVYALLFVVFPFAAYFIYTVCESKADWLTLHRDNVY